MFSAAQGWAETTGGAEAWSSDMGPVWPTRIVTAPRRDSPAAGRCGRLGD